ncbi:ABC-type branched-chain amino acid transport system, substrate-binding protein [Streptomyces sp. WMMB 714]|uniref:hypothetical protein n=1 Tax=Streptomyces sp. WMMB 714 TaxID=1286822 RepID=UPI0005F83A8F|nr:hypothetical protein [Streptomyces sp. WMMB 714]SCK17485.1 ABC-type branched-chain amino acid transport system, substrate-binding protein [Streptomyces sp. WMMB 714]
MPEFPGWDGRKEFVAAFRAAVRTRHRLRKRVPKLPPVVLRTGPELSEQALSALEEGLQRSSTLGRLVPCVPYVRLDGEGRTRTELIEQIVGTLRRDSPPETGKWRFPTYDMVHSITEEPRPDPVSAHPAPASGTVGLGPFTLSIPWPAVREALESTRKRLWSKRWQLRFAFGRRYGALWPDGYRGPRTLDAALKRFDEVRREGTDAWDELLLTALMTDLYGQARQGLLLQPGRRRRRARVTLLLNGSGAGAETVSGFVSLYDERLRVSPNPAMVVVAALPPEAAGESGRAGLADAARRLADTRREARPSLHVALPEPAGVSEAVPPVWKAWLRVRPGKELLTEAVALAVAAWLAGMFAFLGYEGPFLEENTECLEASTYVDQGRRGHDSPKAGYQQAIDEIDELSKQAEKEGDPDRTVTLALIHSTVAENMNELRSGGAIPELRGVAMAMRSLNESAPKGDDRVWVKVRRYNAGVQYEKAEQKAKEIIADAGKDSRFLGVTGFTESRKRTLAALELLNDARIPVVSSTATAKRMEVGRYYHGVAPNNVREANVVASFLKRANTVRTGADSCEQPQHVAVVTDPADVYSNELGLKFAQHPEAPPTGARIGYTPGDSSAHGASGQTDLEMKYSMGDVAAAVCTRVEKEPRTLVYWTSRVREFEAFLEDYQNTACANEELTIVGGNELTNAALSGGYADESWLRLYHTAHTLPVGHSKRSARARAFNRAYTDQFGREDLWANDGHASLANDAVKVFAQAAEKALEVDLSLDISNVHQYIINGSFSMEGASGHIRFANGALRPLNKMLVLLHHKKGRSGAALVCGKTGNNIDAGKEWKQGEETYTCPED